MSELLVSEVSLHFGGIRALDSVTVTVEPGSLCALVGPNGAGKSSLFNCVSGLYRPTSGSIRFRDHELTGRRPHSIAALGIGRTFQNLAVLEKLSVLDNVLLGGHLTDRPRGWVVADVLHLPWSTRAERRLRTRAHVLLERLGLTEVAGERASDLSFGTLKRVELARALMNDPTLLLVDEPAGGLTETEVDTLGALIRSIVGDLGLTALLVEHHMGLVSNISDRVVVLDAGRLIADGDPDAVLQDPAVVTAYLGGVA
ncbi:ABC transporter ATP-binding protein [Pseudonocardia sp. RS010]|uniref:ABC transporter ATP-binding protein n=1 Tax=Pseudonocardia sp. RS010 TaxID=3385979 RepID=UPI0039A15605